MSILGWRVHFTRRGLAQPLTPSPLLKSLPDLDAWLDEHGVLDGETFLLDPCGRYDVELNRFFAGPLSLKARDTQAAVARDVKNFLNFLWFARGETGEKGWRDANPDDRVAYEKWRRKDPAGPRVQDASWDREVASVNSFYQWAVGRGTVAVNPIRHRWIREYRSPAVDGGVRYRPRRRIRGGGTSGGCRRRPTGGGGIPGFAGSMRAVCLIRRFAAGSARGTRPTPI